MKNIIFVTFLLLSTFQCSTSNKKPIHDYHTQLEEILDALKLRNVDQWIGPNLIQRTRDNNNDHIEVDPNDQVNVKLWNKLNEQDMKNMPEITDYSNEDIAQEWLRWYYRIARRNYQVKTKLKKRNY